MWFIGARECYYLGIDNDSEWTTNLIFNVIEWSVGYAWSRALIDIIC